ncbi:MAG: hypothetical protein ACKVZJ_06740 [Phycisphaerales bacterium]
MVLNLLVITIIILSALLWGAPQRGRGLFSALIHFACVIAAGGVAFAVWEPLVYGVLLKSAPDYAWTLGLLAPFIVSLLIFRIVTDLTVPKNMDLGDAANFVGGGVFGGAAGLITAGMVVLGISHLRSGKELLGYTPLNYSGGSLVAEKKLWIPVDRLVVTMYEVLSTGGFGSEDALALRAPRAWEAAAMMRTTLRGSGENQAAIGRTTMQPGDMAIKGRYTVGPLPADTATLDSFILVDGKPSKTGFKDSTGAAPSGEINVEGFVLEFNSGAAEKSGQVVLGPGQIRLVCKSGSTAIALQPAAIIARPEAGGGMYRFRMDAPEIFIPSVGGGSSSIFAPEFFVPKGATPTDLIVKGVRYPLSKLDASKTTLYPNTAMRDDAIRNGAMFQKFGLNVGGGAPGGAAAGGSAGGAAAGGSGGASTSPPSAGQVIKNSGGRMEEFFESVGLPDSLILNAGEIGKLELNAQRQITDGEHQFDKSVLANNRGIDRNLRVDQFARTRDTTIVQVTLSNQGAMSLLGRSVEAAEDILPPMLIDTNGQQYEAIGYVYSEGNIVKIRFTPGKPLRGLSELPSRVSRSKRDQTVRLLFRPTVNVSIASFALGTKPLATFDPPVKMGGG